MGDRDHPFFRPLWRRVGIVAFCAAWAAWEYYNKQELWAWIAGGMAAYGAWIYLWTYKTPAPDAPPDTVADKAPDKE